MILAGGSRDEVCDGTAAINKAFVSVGGMPMVKRVLNAVRAVPEVAQVAVVAPAGILDDDALSTADVRRVSGEGIVESMESGFAGSDDNAMMLLLTSDAPVMRPGNLREFVRALERSDADLVYGIAEKKAHLAAYPDVPHTWARMRDGIFCGGAAFGMRPRALPALKRFLGDLAAARKSPLRLARSFGWDVVLRFAVGMLPVSAAEARASVLLGHPVRAIVVSPDLAFNVDRKTDLALAEKYANSTTR